MTTTWRSSASTTPKVNALSTAVLDGIRLAALELAADPPGAVVVTGGERIFAAGADISEFAGPDEARTIGALFVETTLAIESIPVWSSPPSPVSRWVAAASSRSRATCASRPTTPRSGSPRSCWASSPVAAARNG